MLNSLVSYFSKFFIDKYNYGSPISLKSFIISHEGPAISFIFVKYMIQINESDTRNLVTTFSIKITTKL